MSSKTLIGIHKVGPSSFNDELDSGSKFADQIWKVFIPQVIDAGISVERIMYGVSWPADENTPPQLIHYFAGFEPDTEDVPAEFDKLELEDGNYFSYIYTGSMRGVDSGFIDAYTVELPQSGLVGREGQHIEIYPVNFNPLAELVTFEILIPVE
jgi:predicted transcriptional regulator YdeE